MASVAASARWNDDAQGRRFAGSVPAGEPGLAVTPTRDLVVLDAAVARHADHGVGQRIRDTRRARNLTLKMVAREIGVTAAQMHRYELGTTRVSASRLIDIARALSVNSGDLIGAGPAVRPGEAAPANDTGIDICDLLQIFTTLRTPQQRKAVIAMARTMASLAPAELARA